MNKVYLPLIVVDFQKKLMQKQFASLVIAHHEKTKPQSSVPHPSKKDVLISRFIVHNKTPITQGKHTIVWVINKPLT